MSKYTARMISLVSICIVVLPLTAQTSSDAPTGWSARSTAEPASELLPMPSTTSPELAESKSNGVPDGADLGLDGTGPYVSEEYDIRIFTDRYPQDPHPEQMIVDWVLRETGTQAWFGDPPAVLSASREKLRVRHQQEVQDIVARIVDRFLSPHASAHQFGVRLITVGNPNWRAKAAARLRPVEVQSDGVEAWILSREDASLVLAELKARGDFREYSSASLTIPNGQRHEIVRRTPVAYMKFAAPAGEGSVPAPWQSGQIQEGLTAEFSPLLGADGRSVEAVVKLETTQIERLTPISLVTSLPGMPRQSVQIQVPQTSGTRMHERFRWPVEQVLLISCGMVSIADPGRVATLPIPLLRSRPQRADALLVLEAKQAPTDAAAEAAQANRSQPWNFRGRY